MKRKKTKKAAQIQSNRAANLKGMSTAMHTTNQITRKIKRRTERKLCVLKLMSRLHFMWTKDHAVTSSSASYTYG